MAGAYCLSVVVAALWWGLNHWLDQMLATLLPGR
jgi:type VI secretion system protein ImpK